MSPEVKVESVPSIGQKRPYDKMAYDEDSDEESRFSMGNTIMDDDLIGVKSEELTQEEIDAAKKEKAKKIREELRQYGDRVLLGRQIMVKHADGTNELKGMLALGGGNQTDMLWYKKENKRSNPAVFNDTFKFRYAFALSESWNCYGPQYAGQVSASIVQCLPPDGYSIPFSIFMRRTNNKNTLLGWEYCGEYLAEDMGVGMYQTPNTQQDKDGVVETIMNSIGNPTGRWHDILDDTREEVKYILDHESDSSDATKLRSLGLDNENLSDQEFAEKIVHWEGFFPQRVVRFVRYDEDMYNFVKEGVTTRDKDGKLVSKSHNRCAKASDWYKVLDQRVG